MIVLMNKILGSHLELIIVGKKWRKWNPSIKWYHKCSTTRLLISSSLLCKAKSQVQDGPLQSLEVRCIFSINFSSVCHSRRNKKETSHVAKLCPIYKMTENVYFSVKTVIQRFMVNLN